MNSLLRFLLISFFVVVLTGCTLFSNTGFFLLCLPETPPLWLETFGPLPYLLQYPDPESCQVVQVQIEADIYQIEIRLPKQTNLSILATPQIDSVDLPPAGGVFPHHLDPASPRRILLSWEQGPVASLLLDLTWQGFDPSGFNGARLIEEITEIADGDPWRIDTIYLAEKLAGARGVPGGFRVSYIRQRPARTVEIIPGEGSWFLNSPFAESTHVEEGESLLLPSLCLGYHQLVDMVSGKIYSLYLEEDSFLVVPPVLPPESH